MNKMSLLVMEAIDNCRRDFIGGDDVNIIVIMTKAAWDKIIEGTMMAYFKNCMYINNPTFAGHNVIIVESSKVMFAVSTRQVFRELHLSFFLNKLSSL